MSRGLFSILKTYHRTGVRQMIRALLAACAVFALLAGLQTYRVERLRTDLSHARQERDAAVDSLDKYKGLTLIDAQTQAVVCDTRVREARVSARRIESIINREVPHDADGSPSRVLIGADELRQALQPSLAAEPLH